MEKYIDLITSNYILVVLACLLIALIVILIVVLKKINSRKVVFEDISIEGESPSFIREPVSQKKDEIEILLERMEEALEREKNEVETFEEEQEEKAIISYKELIEANNRNKQLLVSSNDDTLKIESPNNEFDINEVTNTNLSDEDIFEIDFDSNEDLQDSAIETIDDALETSNIETIDSKSESSTEINEKVEEVLPQIAEEEKKKFKATDFVSPVFGVINSVFDYPKVISKKLSYSNASNKKKKNDYELERTLNIDPLTDDVKKNDEFLQALKDFRSKLE